MTIDRDALARTYDPVAFEDHPIEARSAIAAIQWGARRHLATEAADRVVSSEWLTSLKADVRKAALEKAAQIAERSNWTRWGIADEIRAAALGDEQDAPMFECPTGSRGASPSAMVALPAPPHRQEASDEPYDVVPVRP